MKKFVSALLVSAAMTTPAFADGTAGFTDGVVGTKYVVADLGSISYGGSGTATAISVGGGYQIHPAVAIEVDYLHGGSANWGAFPGFAGYAASLTALQVMGVGHYTINSDLVAYAKAGVAFNSYKFTFPNLFQVTTTSNDLTAAIGIRYNLSPAFSLHAQYQDSGTQSISVVSIGAQLNF